MQCSQVLQKKIGFHICKINIDAQKINSSKLETYRTVFALFQVDDQNQKFCIIEKPFY